MTVRAAIVAGLLAALGAAVVIYKMAVLGVGLYGPPGDARFLLEIELALDAVPAGAAVAVALPAPTSTQVVEEEAVDAAGAPYLERRDGAARVGTWNPRPPGPARLVARTRVRLRVPPPFPDRAERSGLGPALPPDDEVPSDAPEVAARAAEVVRGAAHAPGRVRALFEHVRARVRESGEAKTALDVLAAGAGTRAGRTRLLAALLRAAGVPADLVAGAAAADGEAARRTVWVDAAVGGERWPLDLAAAAPGVLAEPRVALRTGPDAEVRALAGPAPALRIRVVREANRVAPGAPATAPARVARWLSLSHLPPQTRAWARVLALLPFAAFGVAVARNVVGVRTFGTFMPVLVAVAFRETTLGWGVGLVVGVVAVALACRAGLERLELLLVPRLSVVLTAVIVVLVAAGAFAESHGLGRAGAAATLFPVVILTMTVERFSATLAEEGPARALSLAAGTLLVAVAGYFVVASRTLELLVTAFPESVLGVLALLVALGRYGGYRLSERIRFRSVPEPEGDAVP